MRLIVLMSVLLLILGAGFSYDYSAQPFGPHSLDTRDDFCYYTYVGGNVDTESYFDYADNDIDCCIGKDFFGEYSGLAFDHACCGDDCPSGLCDLHADWWSYDYQKRKSVSINQVTDTRQYALVDPETYNTTGLIASYHFNDDVKDYMGNNHGTRSEAFFTEGYNGLGTGLEFDGTNDYVSIPSIGGHSVYTQTAWVKWDGLGSYEQYILTTDDGALGIIGGVTSFSGSVSGTFNYWSWSNRAGGPGEQRNAVGGVIYNDEWTFVAVVAEGTNSLKLYVNGVLIKPSYEGLDSIVTPFRNDNIGILQAPVIEYVCRDVTEWVLTPSGWNPVTTTVCGDEQTQPPISPFNGVIDEVRIYERALSGDEILDLYLERKGRLDYGDVVLTTDIGTRYPLMEKDNMFWIYMGTYSTIRSLTSGYMYYKNPSVTAPISWNTYSGITSYYVPESQYQNPDVETTYGVEEKARACCLDVCVPDWVSDTNELPWDDDAYNKRKEITFSYSVIDYPLNFTLDTASLISSGLMNSDCSDLRFYDFDGKKLPYYLESGCNTANSKVFVKILDGSRVYMYYNNPGAVSESTITASEVPALFFDDFDNPTLDSSKWLITEHRGFNTYSVGGAYTISNSTITLLSRASPAYNEESQPYRHRILSAFDSESGDYGDFRWFGPGTKMEWSGKLQHWRSGFGLCRTHTYADAGLYYQVYNYFDLDHVAGNIYANDENTAIQDTNVDAPYQGEWMITWDQNRAVKFYIDGDLKWTRSSYWNAHYFPCLFVKEFGANSSLDYVSVSRFYHGITATQGVEETKVDICIKLYGQGASETWFDLGGMICGKGTLYNDEDSNQKACETAEGTWVGAGGEMDCCDKGFVDSSVDDWENPLGICRDGIWYPGAECLTASDCTTQYCDGDIRYYNGACVSYTCTYSTENCGGDDYCSGSIRIYNRACTPSACVWNTQNCGSGYYCSSNDVYTKGCSGGSCYVTKYDECNHGDYCCTSYDICERGCSGGSCYDNHVDNCEHGCDDGECEEGGLSCPFVDAWNGTDWFREHEAFPFAGSSTLEMSTYDSLPNLKCIDGEAKVRISEELNEITYLKDFVIYKTDQQDGLVKPDINARVRVINEFALPVNCSVSDESLNDDCLSLLSDYDSLFLEPKFNESKIDDWIVVDFTNVESNDVKLYIVARKNQIVDNYASYLLGIFGEERISLVYDLMTSPLTKSLIFNLQENFNLKVELWDGSKWVKQGSFAAGLIPNNKNWADDFLISINKPDNLTDLRVRFSFITGVFSIDYVALDNTPDPELTIEEVAPLNITFNGVEADDFLETMVNGDEFIITYPCTSDEEFFFNITGYYEPYNLAEGLRKDIISVLYEYFSLILFGKPYIVKSIGRMGFWKEDIDWDSLIYKEMPKGLMVFVANIVFIAILTVLVTIFKTCKKITKKRANKDALRTFIYLIFSIFLIFNFLIFVLTVFGKV